MVIRSNVCGVRGGDYRAKRDLVCFAVVCGQLVCHQVPQSGFAAKSIRPKHTALKKERKMMIMMIMMMMVIMMIAFI